MKVTEESRSFVINLILKDLDERYDYKLMDDVKYADGGTIFTLKYDDVSVFEPVNYTFIFRISDKTLETIHRLKHIHVLIDQINWITQNRQSSDTYIYEI